VAGRAGLRRGGGLVAARRRTIAATATSATPATASATPRAFARRPVGIGHRRVAGFVLAIGILAIGIFATGILVVVAGQLRRAGSGRERRLHLP